LVLPVVIKLVHRIYKAPNPGGVEGVRYAPVRTWFASTIARRQAEALCLGALTLPAISDVVAIESSPRRVRRSSSFLQARSSVSSLVVLCSVINHEPGAHSKANTMVSKYLNTFLKCALTLENFVTLFWLYYFEYIQNNTIERCSYLYDQ
jgi:hypothetical protein